MLHPRLELYVYLLARRSGVEILKTNEDQIGRHR